MSLKKKIIIIGAGPIGCYTAQLLKRYGYAPAIIEEHNDVGRPVHCTGLIGEKVFSEKRPFRLPASSIVNTINGATIHFENQSFTINRNHVAYVIDRERFDKEMGRGLDIVYGTRFLGLEETSSGYIIDTDKDKLEADIVIGADGASSVIRKILNPGWDNVQTLKGVQLRISSRLVHKDMAEVFLQEQKFFWIVPESDTIIRAGTISDNPHQDLEGFLKRTGIKGDVIERFGGLVSTGLCPVTAKNNIAIVGDAACQLKPLSYGGIYFGLKTAGTLATCLKQNRLLEYDKRWKTELGQEIRLGLKIKTFYNKLTAKELARLFSILKSQKGLIEKIADFENHSHIIISILKNPFIYAKIGSLLNLLFDTL